jgi:hypothetical protein
MAYSYKVISANSPAAFETAVQTLLDSTPDDQGYYPLGSMVTSHPPVGAMVFSQAFIRQL